MYSFMMKKFLLILCFVIIFQTPSYSKIGKGEVKMSPQILKYFIEYLRNEYTEHKWMWDGSGKGLAMSSSVTDENILLIMKDLGFVD